MNKSIYDLELHEQITLHHGNIMTRITRVAGGWLYLQTCSEAYVSVTFVPFHNEFMV